MKAIRFHRLGGPEVLQLDDVPVPKVVAGSVLVRVRAAGVNYADTRFRRGEYFVRPSFPQICGMEAAGEVVEVGEGVTDFVAGDRVMALGANAYAEYVSVPAHLVYAIPDALAFEEAAALPVQGLTAHHLLTLCGRLQRGERVLVHAAAGGVGTLAVQLAKHFGAGQVLGTAGSPEKLALAQRLGADVVIDYTREDVVARVKDATAGQGVDVLLEMLGGTDALRRNLACLGRFGRMIVFGAASGDTHGTIEPVALMPKNQTVTGYYLTPILSRRELCAPALDELARLAATRGLEVVVGHRFALADAAEAHRRMEERATVGKIVLVP